MRGVPVPYFYCYWGLMVTALQKNNARRYSTRLYFLMEELSMTVNSQIQLFQAADSKVELKVSLDQDTVWLTQAQMCELFDKNKRTVSEHIGNIFKEGKLEETSVVRKFRITAADGKTYDTNHYNLDVTISVGYRVKSQRGVQFRHWATGSLSNT